MVSFTAVLLCWHDLIENKFDIVFWCLLDMIKNEFAKFTVRTPFTQKFHFSERGSIYKKKFSFSKVSIFLTRSLSVWTSRGTPSDLPEAIRNGFTNRSFPIDCLPTLHIMKVGRGGSYIIYWTPLEKYYTAGLLWWKCDEKLNFLFVTVKRVSYSWMYKFCP